MTRHQNEPRFVYSSMEFATLLLLIAGAAALHAQSDAAPIEVALRELRGFCDADKGSMWGTSLCGRIVFADARSRLALSTHPDREGRFQQQGELYRGTLPREFEVANTSIDWGGQRWTMVSLPLPRDPFPRLRLLAHESFHRMQTGLKLNAADQPCAHLDTDSGRLWLRLELRALAQALRHSGRDSERFLADALLFRAVRNSLHPGSRKREAALEIQEGLAEYTGTAVALRQTGESVLRVARETEAGEDRDAFARSFAYLTGPALGLLLDRHSPGWRRKLQADSDLTDLMPASVGTSGTAETLLTRARNRAAQYGFRAVAAAEREREDRRQRALAEYKARFLDGPVLEIPKGEISRTFNPNNLVSFGEHGTVYPTGTFTGNWGRLVVEPPGALLGPGNDTLRVAAPAGDVTATSLAGPGWKLELSPDWTVRPATKPGSFVLAPK